MQLRRINVLRSLNCLVKLAYFLVSMWDFKEGADLNTQYPVCVSQKPSQKFPIVCVKVMSVKSSFFLFFFSIARELIKISI